MPKRSCQTDQSGPRSQRQRADRWPQASIDVGIKSLFPEEWTVGVEMPFVEDIVNGGCFEEYANWVERRGMTAHEAAAPSLGIAASRLQVAAMLSFQMGVHDSKHALSPAKQEIASQHRHLAAAISLADANVFPSNRTVTAETDLEFAAHNAIANIDNLARHRARNLGAFKELARRRMPLTKALRRRQVATVAAAAGGVNVGFIAVLVIILNWPNRLLPRLFLTGFGVIGHLESSGVSPAGERAASSTKHDVVNEAKQRIATWSQAAPPSERLRVSAHV